MLSLKEQRRKSSVIEGWAAPRGRAWRLRLWRCFGTALLRALAVWTV